MGSKKYYRVIASGECVYRGPIRTAETVYESLRLAIKASGIDSKLIPLVFAVEM